MLRRLARRIWSALTVPPLLIDSRTLAELEALARAYGPDGVYEAGRR